MNRRRLRRAIGLALFVALLAVAVRLSRPLAFEAADTPTLTTPSDFGADIPLVELTRSDTLSIQSETQTPDAPVLAVAATPGVTPAVAPGVKPAREQPNLAGLRNPFSPVRVVAAPPPTTAATTASAPESPNPPGVRAAVPAFEATRPDHPNGPLPSLGGVALGSLMPEPLTEPLLGSLHALDNAQAHQVGASDAPASLADFVRLRGLRFTGTVAGPTSVAVFRRQGSDTPWVVPIGGRLPESEITLIALQTTQASLRLGDDTFVLELDTRR